MLALAKQLAKLSTEGASEDKPEDCEVFALDLPFDVLEEQMLAIFKSAGEVVELRFHKDFSDSLKCGFCYVRYKSRKEAQYAVDILDGYPVKGTPMLVRISCNHRTLFVAHIPEIKTKQELIRELKHVNMHGVKEVFLYKSYEDQSKNRGFAFLEFDTHQAARDARSLSLEKPFRLWGKKLILDWGNSIPRIADVETASLDRLFIRNLKVCEDRSVLVAVLKKLVGLSHIEKVYRNKDYAFVHFKSSSKAAEGLELLKLFYKHSAVEVTWAIPSKLAQKSTRYKRTKAEHKELTSLKKAEVPLKNTKKKTCPCNLKNTPHCEDASFMMLLQPRGDFKCPFLKKRLAEMMAEMGMDYF